MGPLKCCVGSCNATSASHRLFCFPTNDSLRNLWMSFLVPTNSALIGLSKEQLRFKRVCEKHFDEHQFDQEGRRLRYSYPCLFTEDEIEHGVPLSSPGAVYSILSEHNYVREQDDSTDTSMIIERPGADFNEHLYCATSQVMTTVMEEKDVVSGQPSCSFTNESIMATPRIGKQRITHKQKDSTIKKFIYKKRKFMGQVTKIAMESLGKTGLQRLEQAQVCAMNEHLFKNFYLLNKQAQSFIIMQLKQCHKNKMARRFTLDEKLLAMVLMKQSPKSYKLLEKMFALPNKRTLSRLSGNISMEPGINIEIFNHIKNKIRKWSTNQKLCTIVFDEISLTPHLTFNEKNDRIYGFVNVDRESRMKFCDHALVFMLRGICSPWRQSVAYYFCEGTVPAAALQNILKQMVSQVVQTGLIPLGLVCDQGSTFRTAIKQFKEDTLHTHNIQGTQDDGSVIIAGHSLSVFYDPPHLLKGLRNNFLTKEIILEGKTASWQDIRFIYDLDSTLGHTRALPKITAHHVIPNKIKKMKVSIATQVFSARTAAMLKYTNAINNLHTGKSTTMETTAEIVEFFDQLFDSVNGYPGGTVKGKLRKAVKNNSPHHQFWIRAIKKLKSLKFQDTNSKLAIRAGKPRLVRVPSLEGWITTLESFIRVSKLLFENYDVDYYYPRNINQDPLENFFGRVRALNYRNINPDANTFIHGFKSIVLSNFLSPQSKFFNCEEDDGDILIDTSFILKKKNEDKENISPNIGSQLSTSQAHPTYSSGSITKDEVITERIKVQCSAYTAGYICRKMSNIIKCKSCLQTYTSSSVKDIHMYIQHREYKTLKKNNLVYPNEKFLILYRDASQYIHNYLNKNCHKDYISKIIKKNLMNLLRFSWLGCNNHNKVLVNVFIKNISRLHIHNWCNIINKILKGAIEEKYALKMEAPQIIASRKYKTLKMRKAVNK